MEPLPKIGKLLQKLPGGGIVITSLNTVLNWSKSNSLWYLSFATACCGIEGLMASGASRYDLDRLGLIFRGSPRQADLMIVAGTINEKMAPRVFTLYEQMPFQKYVIAFGACAISGGPFYDAYSVVKGVDRVIPVDIYVPGCPPRPEALFDGILQLQKKIKQESIAKL